MNVIWTTLKRELMGYFFSPVGYLIAVLLYFWRGFEVSGLIDRVRTFAGDVDQFASAYVLQPSSLIMVLLVPPILTMRCFADERRSGSLEVLMTAPVRRWEVVVGKWGAAFTFFCVLCLPTLAILWILAGDDYLASDLSFAPVVAGYLGLVFVAALVMAVGVFTSSLTDNVLLAVLSSMLFGAAMLFGYGVLLPHVVRYFPEHPWLEQMLAQFHVIEQLRNWFSRGLIDTSFCTFYVGGVAFFLFLTTAALEIPRWAVGGGRRIAGIGMLAGAAVIALLVWGMLTVLATRPAMRFLIDVSPQAQFTFSDDTEELLEEIRDRGLTLEIDTFYELPPAPSNNPEARYYLGLAGRVQELTQDLVRVFGTRGGDAVVVTDHDLVRGNIQKARERRKELNALRNSIVVKIGKRRRTLSLMNDLADIELPQTQRMPTPGAQRTRPIFRSYKGEEAVSSAIRSLLVEGTPRVYFLTGYGQVSITAGVADSYSELAGALVDDGFEVAEWNLRQEGYVPEDATMVALFEPIYELSQRDADALYAYVKGGGRMVLNVAFREFPVDHNPKFQRLGDLLGFEVGLDLVTHLVRDPRNPESPGRGGRDAQTVTTVLNPLHPITKALATEPIYPIFKAVRALRVPEQRPEGVHVDPSLVRTGPWAWLAPRTANGEVDFRPPPNRESYTQRPVGLLIDVDPDEGERQGHVVVFGGAAFRNEGDAFQLNGNLALNVFNWMAERRELVSVRANSYVARRMTLAPQQVERASRFLVWYVPGVLVLLAGIVFFLRRRQ